MYDHHHDGWEALANAIIVTAVEDLRAACRGKGEAAEDLKNQSYSYVYKVFK